METKVPTSLLPKHLQNYYAWRNGEDYADKPSEFFQLIKEITETFEQKLIAEKGNINSSFYELNMSDLMALKQELKQASSTSNEYNLEKLCRCIANQENAKNPLLKFLLHGLATILMRLDKGEIAINYRGSITFENMVAKLKAAAEESTRVTRNLAIAEEALKNRDAAWVTAHESLLRIQSEHFTNILDNHLKKIDLLKAEYHEERAKSKRDTKDRLAAKDQMIISLTNKIEYLNNQILELQEDLAKYASSTTDKSSYQSPGLANKLSVSMTKALNSPNSVARRLNFSNIDHSNSTIDTSVPDFDDLNGRFKKITDGNAK